MSTPFHAPGDDPNDTFGDPTDIARGFLTALTALLIAITLYHAAAYATRNTHPTTHTPHHAPTPTKTQPHHNTTGDVR